MTSCSGSFPYDISGLALSCAQARNKQDALSISGALAQGSVPSPSSGRRPTNLPIQKTRCIKPHIDRAWESTKHHLTAAVGSIRTGFTASLLTPSAKSTHLSITTRYIGPCFASLDVLCLDDSVVTVILLSKPGCMTQGAWSWLGMPICRQGALPGKNLRACITRNSTLRSSGPLSSPASAQCPNEYVLQPICTRVGSIIFSAILCSSVICLKLWSTSL